jgi:hypothetical protein
MIIRYWLTGNTGGRGLTASGGNPWPFFVAYAIGLSQMSGKKQRREIMAKNIGYLFAGKSLVSLRC